MNTEHKIRHFVRAGDETIPREAMMRGDWPCEAKCSCGWETRTGGATRAHIARMVADHKFDVEHGFWHPTDREA